MDKKTLYVSDLDGTLMRSDETLSDFTIETINRLIGQGLAFTYATARSIGSARPIAGRLKLELPVITRNGAVLADNTDGHVIEKSVFTAEEVEFLKTRLPEVAEFGFVSCFLGDRMVRIWLPGKHSPGLQGYIDYYEKDPTLVRADGPETLYCGEPGYVTLIGERVEIAPLYERLREYTGWECLFQKDTYRDEYWLEICPQNCTKAKAIRKMKEKYGFDNTLIDYYLGPDGEIKLRQLSCRHTGLVYKPRFTRNAPNPPGLFQSHSPLCVRACLLARLCLTLCDPMDCSQPGSSVQQNFQARFAIPFSRASFPLREQTRVSCIAGGFFST